LAIGSARGVAGFSLLVPVGLSGGVRVVVGLLLGVGPGVCLGVCRCCLLFAAVVWASGRATGSGFVTATDELAGTSERNALT